MNGRVAASVVKPFDPTKIEPRRGHCHRTASATTTTTTASTTRLATTATLTNIISIREESRRPQRHTKPGSENEPGLCIPQARFNGGLGVVCGEGKSEESARVSRVSRVSHRGHQGGRSYVEIHPCAGGVAAPGGGKGERFDRGR